MLTKFQRIINFAVFKNYDWDQSVRDKGNNVATFKKLNIIYGRNYSGKTSLSRIIRSLETGVKHEKYRNASYVFSNTENHGLTDKNLTENPYTVRVYNKDFLDENLKFLTNIDGSIKPFTILGEKNIELENEITEKEKQLGSIQGKNGLYWDQHRTELERKKVQDSLSTKQRKLEDSIREKANTEIKHNTLYRNPNYNISAIRSDISIILNGGTFILDAESRNELISVLTEAPKSIINFQAEVTNKLSLYEKNARDLLEKDITPTQTIKELLDNHLLEEWVRSGLHHHVDKDECQFCGNTLTNEIWGRLKGHFSKESETLREWIDQLILEIRKEQKIVSEITFPLHADFYLVLQRQYKELNSKVQIEVAGYIADLDRIILVLEDKKNDIYSIIKLPHITRKYKISTTISEIKELVQSHNNRTVLASNEQDQARRSLRLSEIASFIKDIGYESKIEENDRLSNESKRLRLSVESLHTEISKITKEISHLQDQLRDERKGAERVNYHLKNHFGHDALQLVAIENPDSKAITFSITRHTEPAHNLSEGECSLVAFCYFIAKLDDFETSGKELVIWIDDPISSLDSNQIYFIFSLIENVITKPIKDPKTSENKYKYKQVFISTHNLDFLKYLKRISKPKNDNEFFLIERSNDTSKIKLMPNYLKKYVTEFNYLFSQIHKCSETPADMQNHDAFYNFGNNLRKFLEAYLFYKYPNDKSNDEKLLRFFGGDSLHTDLTNRINNELSHLEEIFDRSMTPIEVPEIPKLAKFVLKTIQDKDPEQFSALLESIKDIE